MKKMREESTLHENFANLEEYCDKYKLEPLSANFHQKQNIFRSFLCILVGIPHKDAKKGSKKWIE
jgi:hypothetical protein